MKFQPTLSDAFEFASRFKDKTLVNSFGFNEEIERLQQNPLIDVMVTSTPPVGLWGETQITTSIAYVETISGVARPKLMVIRTYIKN